MKTSPEQDTGAWIVAWSTGRDGDDCHWSIVLGRREADARLAELRTHPDVYAAAIAPVADGTDPHWLAGEL